jgi:hypothetical protein
MNEEKKDSAIIIGPVRLSWIHIWEPRLDNLSGRTEYSATLLIPKKPTKQCPDPDAVIAQVKEAVLLAMSEKFGEPGGKKWPKNWRNPLGEDETGEYYQIKVKSSEDRPPVVINGDRITVGPKSGWNAGDWGKAKIWPFSFDQQVNKGASFKLNAIQFLYKDEPFGGSIATSPDEFDKVDDADKPEGNGHEPDPDFMENYDPFGPNA